MSCEAIHCFDRATVRFAIYPDEFDGPRVLAEIAEDALRDVFGARHGGDSLVAACQMHFGLIELVALKRYRTVPDLPILLQTADFSAIRAAVESVTRGGVIQDDRGTLGLTAASSDTGSGSSESRPSDYSSQHVAVALFQPLIRKVDHAKVTSRPTRKSRSAKPNTSRRATKKVASPRRRLSDVLGRP